MEIARRVVETDCTQNFIAAGLRVDENIMRTSLQADSSRRELKFSLPHDDDLTSQG